MIDTYIPGMAGDFFCLFVFVQLVSLTLHHLKKETDPERENKIEMGREQKGLAPIISALCFLGIAA